MSDGTRQVGGYLLGYEETERRRLEFQARVIDASTREVLLAAGLRPGMRVLDVGCGTGNVTAVVASIVGPTGSVTGLDRSDAGFARAREIAAEHGLSNVSFEVAQVPDLAFGREFDAVVGRLVLMYFRDPRAVLGRLLSHVTPGGVVAFQEIVWSSGGSLPEVPSVTHAYDVIRETFRRADLQVDMGERLASDLRALGLRPRAQGITFMDPDGGEALSDWLVGIVDGMLPTTEALGVATRGEMDVPSLAARMRAELSAADATLRAPMLVGCWATVPC